MVNKEESMEVHQKIHVDAQVLQTWPKVAIIVLNWNGWQDTIECLESLQRITYPNYQVIVVDNGSTDDSIEKIKAWARGEIPVESKFFTYDPTTKPVKWIKYDRVTDEIGKALQEGGEITGLQPNRKLVLIQTGRNLGFAGGNNVAVGWAFQRGFDYVLLLNNDTIVDPEALTAMVEIAHGNLDVGLVGCKILYYGSSKVWFAGGKLSLLLGGAYHIRKPVVGNSTISVSQITGCAMLIPRPTWQLVGPLDERYFLTVEDWDYSYRVARAGLKLLVTLRGIIWHKVGQSSDGEKSPTAIYYTTRNRLWFIRRLTFPWCLTAFIYFLGGRLVRAIQYSLKGDWERLAALFRGFNHGLMQKRAPL